MEQRLHRKPCCAKQACFAASVLWSVERNARNHWNAAVGGLTINVRKMLMEMDQQLYEECQKKWEEEEFQSQVEKNRKEYWQKIEALAEKAA